MVRVITAPIETGTRGQPDVLNGQVNAAEILAVQAREKNEIANCAILT